MDVFVSIPPQAFFVERIAGDLAEVHVMVGPGQSPHTLEPTPKQLTDLAKARVYFAIGLPFERRLLGKIGSISPNIRIVHTEGGVPYRLMRAEPAGHKRDELQPESENVTGHVHGQGPRGRGAVPDPHIWLSPKLVKIQAATIAKVLQEMDPAHAVRYRTNLKHFIASLDDVDKKIAGELTPYRGRPFYVYHPAFGYFADAYGLVQVPIEREGKDPGASEIAAIIESAKVHRAKTIFVEPQFPKGQAEAIARAIGGKVVGLDPLARDYLNNLELMAGRIRKALTEEGR
jgi:zinc transport system substrate-binding protein